MALEEVLAVLDTAEQRLLDLCESSTVPAEPDREWVDDWLHRSHLDYWRRLGS